MIEIFLQQAKAYSFRKIYSKQVFGATGLPAIFTEPTFPLCTGLPRCPRIYHAKIGCPQVVTTFCDRRCM